LNDGAAALVIMSDVRAAELGITPLARIVSTGVSALSPEIMGITPVEATRRALAHAGMTVADLDLAEINEAFAAQVIPCVRELGLDELQWRDKEIGLETMCAAGGQGMAMIIQRLS
jgi:acetyl-CoA C-acetyltransferase